MKLSDLTVTIRTTAMENGTVLAEGQCADCPAFGFMVAIPIPGEQWERNAE